MVRRKFFSESDPRLKWTPKSANENTIETIDALVKIGDSWYDEATNQLNQWDGTRWVSVDSAVTTGIFNVKDPRFGAKGDGVTDDSAAIQAALNAMTAGRTWKETVYIGPGNFICNTQLTLSSFTRLVVKGKLQYGGADSGTFVLLRATNANDIEITGGGELFGGGNAQYLIRVDTAARLSIHGLTLREIRQAGAYVELQGSCTFVQIIDNTFRCNRKGLGINILDSSHHVEVVGNSFDFPYDSAVDCSMVGTGPGDPVKQISIIGNTAIKNNLDAGFGFAVHNRCRDIVIDGNTVEGSLFDGIGIIWDGAATQPESIIVSNNIVRGTARHGILTQGKNVLIIGNAARANSGAGIQINNGICSVLGNRVSNNGSHGIVGAAAAIADVLIANNRCYDDQTPKTQGYGIILGSGNTTFVVCDNDVRGNLTGGILVDGGITVARIHNNPGFNPQGSDFIGAAGDSPYTWTNNDNTPEMIYIRGGTVSDIAKNGQTLFTNTDHGVWLEPGEATIITHSVAPTLVRDRK